MAMFLVKSIQKETICVISSLWNLALGKNVSFNCHASITQTYVCYVSFVYFMPWTVRSSESNVAQ